MYVRVFRHIIALQGVAFALLAMTSSLSASDDVLAIVNGDTITANSLAANLSQMHSSQTGTQHRGEFSVERLLQKIVNNTLLRQEAIAIGLDEDEHFQSKVRDYRESIAFKALVNDLSPQEVTVSNSDLREGFERLYRGYRLRLICVGDSGLCAILSDSIVAGTSMADLAMRHSIDKYQSSGGYAGVYTPDELPVDLQRRLSEASVNDLIGPIFLWRVWTLVRVEEIIPADWAGFDGATEKLKELLTAEKHDRLRRDYLDSLHTVFYVSIDSSAVDSVLIDMLQGRESTTRPIVLVGESRMITAAEFRNKYIHRVAGKRDREARAVLYEVLRDQIDMMLLKESAARSDFMNQPRFNAAVELYSDSLLVNAYLTEVVAPSAKVSEAEIEDYYGEHKQNFRLPGRVKIATFSRDSLADAKAAYERIMAGADFEWVAKQITGGSTGSITQDWMSVEAFAPELRPKLESAPLGSVFPPVSGEAGFTVFKLVDREAGKPIPFEDARDRIVNVLAQRKQIEVIDKILKELRADADIVIMDQAIERITISGPTEEE